MTTVTLTLSVTHLAEGGQIYELADSAGPLARSPFSCMLIYAYELERVPGTIRALGIADLADSHNVLKDEYFRRYAEQRRVARTARSASADINTVNLQELGLL